ncbi:hypothetical protein IHQ71_23150 [Rhizobium sp. TH2]|nr:hypothetical protein [Rhizobium sp. TH2]UVC08036.1 hypothetical protein IHQ71_23150 [Rhizobium sp. TH2]
MIMQVLLLESIEFRINGDLHRHHQMVGPAGKANHGEAFDTLAFSAIAAS